MFKNRLSKFRKNLGLTMIASIVSFVISLALTPIMTRYYDPSDYGIFAVVNSTATFIATAFLFSLPNAILMESSWQRRAQLLRALLQLAVFAFFLSAVGVILYLGFKSFVDNFIGVQWFYLSIPLLTLSIVLHRTAQGWAVAEGDFFSLASARVVHPLVAKPFAILASMLTTSNPLYMILFEALGFFIQSSIMVRSKLDRLKVWPKFFTRRRIRATIGVIRRHRDYSLFLNLVNLIILASGALQIIILANNFTVAETGLYSLALGMTNLPVQLIALATASVIYHQLVLVLAEEPHLLFQKVLKYLFAYIALGTVPYLIIFFYGDDLFGIVFGSKWAQSGKIASILSLPMYIQFVLMPLLSIFMVTKTIKLQFKIDLFFNILIVAVLLIVSYSHSFIETISIHAILLSVYRFSAVGFCLYVAKSIAQDADNLPKDLE